MRKLIALLCTVAVVAWAAQAGAATTWTAGVKGGVNLADVGGDNAPDDTSMRTGFMGGAFAQANFTDQFGVRLEGLYVMKGATETLDTLSVSVDVTTKLDYIEFPLLFVANLTSGEKVALNLFAGPTFAFKINAEEDAGDYGSEDISDFIKGFEFGAAVGAGLEYKLTSMSLIFDARYSLGATSVAEDDDVTGESFDVKNRGIGLMAGVAFPLGGGAE